MVESGEVIYAQVVEEDLDKVFGGDWEKDEALAVSGLYYYNL